MNWERWWPTGCIVAAGWLTIAAFYLGYLAGKLGEKNRIKEIIRLAPRVPKCDLLCHYLLGQIDDPD